LKVSRYLIRAATLILMVSAMSFAQSLATIQGTVTGANRKAISGASINLQLADAPNILTTRSSSEGAYQFANLAPGKYTLRAQDAAGHEVAYAVVLTAGENRRFDFRIAAVNALATNHAAEFYDKASFTVAGVTDTTNLGGHASNATLGTTEALNKGVAALGRSPSHTGGPVVTTEALNAARARAGRAPADYAANYEAGKLLVESGQPGEAIGYLKHASAIQPADYKSSYELALAYADAGEWQLAHTSAVDLLRAHDTAEVHHLLGRIADNSGDPLTAVTEYQHAAQLSPDESNLFDWGTELLVHRAIQPSIEVFTRGNHLFPRSTRMLAGLGVARFAQGSHDLAAEMLSSASDLNPSDPVPYLLLGKVVEAQTSASPTTIQTLQRFAALEPENPRANYYSALASAKGPDKNGSSARIEDLLRKAVAVDPKFGEAYLQLGILYSEQKDFPRAISSLIKAITVSPDLAQAHYNLGLVYAAVGDRAKAEIEMQAYKRLSKQAADKLDRERHEIQQFVYTLRDAHLSPTTP